MNHVFQNEGGNTPSKTSPFSFSPGSFPPLLKSANCPTPCLFSLRTLKKNHISQSTPIILKLKVTKFLVELSQFKLLVNTDNKHFCLQAFFVMKYSCIFYAKTVPQEERGRGTLC